MTIYQLIINRMMDKVPYDKFQVLYIRVNEVVLKDEAGVLQLPAAYMSQHTTATNIRDLFEKNSFAWDLWGIILKQRSDEVFWNSNYAPKCTIR